MPPQKTVTDIFLFQISVTPYKQKDRYPEPCSGWRPDHPNLQEDLLDYYKPSHQYKHRQGKDSSQQGKLPTQKPYFKGQHGQFHCRKCTEIYEDIPYTAAFLPQQVSHRESAV